MSVERRIARLELIARPPERKIADRLSDALIAARIRFFTLTPAERLAWEVAKHQAALAAKPPGESASALARRIYSANLRLAHSYFGSSRT